MKRWVLRLACINLCLIGAAQAQLVNENFLVTMPEGYRIDFEDRQGNMVITEMVPDGESVKDWTEMVTVQIFLSERDLTVDQLKARIQKLWTDSCINGSAADIGSLTENGYSTTLWVQVCSLNSQTGKPEFTWFKAVQGNDSLYLVQKAFKFQPSPEQITQWMHYLKRISVCDSRLPDRICPKTN